MREYYKEKIKSLIALRSNLFTVVIVLTGGVMGLFFTGKHLLNILPFALLGAYFDFIFLTNLLYVNNKIDLTLEELKQ